ncbi:hypothetical protein ACVOMV_15735 [Mesorhizobium atlanticum]
MVYLLALLLGIAVDLNPLRLLAAIVMIALGSGLFSTFSLHHRLYRQDSRTLHGHRSGPDHADLLRQQCDISH